MMQLSFQSTKAKPLAGADAATVGPNAYYMVCVWGGGGGGGHLCPAIMMPL